MAVKFTNKFNLPQIFVDAVLVDDHVVNGNISVTQLIDAPQVRMLKRTNDYSMDVMEMIGMVHGTGIHAVLERSALKGSRNAKILQQASGILLSLGEEKGANYLKKMIDEKLKEDISTDIITERNLTIEVEGWTISGTMDLYTESLGLLQDYKTTSASSVMFPETKKSYNAQLNIYAAMLRINGYAVNKAQIIAILKDWSKMKVMQSRDYPRNPVEMMDIQLLDHEVVMDYITKRVILHQRAENGETIPCSSKDRWAKADTWAIKKKGGKKAIKLNPSEQLAKGKLEEIASKYKPGELYIEHRPGESFRCANGYCPMSDVCPQYKAEIAAKVAEAESM